MRVASYVQTNRAGTGQPVLTWVVLFLVLVGLAHSASGQTASADSTGLDEVRLARQETEQELQELEAQIADFEGRLTVTKQEEQSTLKRLEELNRQIAVRRRLITTYRERNRQLRTERREIQSTVESLEQEVAGLREQYKRLVTHAYKHGRTKYLALILSASSINRAFIRIKYLRLFTEQRRRKFQQIAERASQLVERQSQLVETITRNEELARKEDSERQNLSQLRRSRSQVLNDVKARRSELEQELTRSRRQAEQLQARLTRLIAAETERMRVLSAADPIAAAEFAALAAQFNDNRGALPWPVSGAISEPFGTRIHPVYRTRTINPGIEIATRPAADVRTVFDGTVGRVFAMPGYGTCITVRHGDYTSLYGNFSSTSVQQGQRVAAGQVIGKAGTGSEPRRSALFFALFTKEGKAVDPTGWLKKQ